MGMPLGHGHQWSFKPKDGAIKKIIVGCGWIIDSLMFKADHYSAKFGSPGGFVKIRIDYPSEFLIGISGTYGKGEHMSDNVCTLTFHTNKNQYGPFGSKPGPTPFSLIANGAAVMGFHGRCGQYVEAIGLYIKPLSSLSTELKKQPSQNASSCVPRFLLPPRSAAAMGGNGGRDWDDGVFAAVKGVHVCVRVDTGVLSAVRFSYLKNDGSAFLSPFHGGYCEGDVHLKEVSISKTVVFCEEDEYLIGVDGFNGVAEGSNVVTSLSFMTNKGRYGPLGAEIGTYFTSMNSGECSRKVVGFHGRCGAYLDAIGLHTQYF
ncbi:agglutinin-like [Salvia miltiorrhiza]|uniref:agglutinin-like n=1 Tax=Salvia miltiorrhiza TaxID=226208 RepID=UPI0025AC90C4|nr:agglutinin-like [Salvia miltiorrhiza]